MNNDPGDGGMGIMQITPKDGTITEPVRWDYLWNWQKNVNYGRDLYTGEKLSSAVGYPKSLLTQPGFINAVASTNAWRNSQGLPSPNVRMNVPEFTAVQALQDAVRGFNGFASPSPFYQWQFGRSLHEFRLKTFVDSTTGDLVLNLQNEKDDPQHPGGRLADVIWERVPVSARPPKEKGGDPHYVQHVYNFYTQLGGIDPFGEGVDQ